MNTRSQNTALNGIKRIHSQATTKLDQYDEESSETALQMLQKNFEKYEAQHEEIIVKAKEEEVDGLEGMYAAVEAMVVDATNLLKRRQKTLKSQLKEENSGAQPGFVAPNDMRLPPLKIKQFDGEDENWLEFRDMFEAMVHTRPNVDAACKLARLKESIDPVKVTQVSGVYTGGYETVWAELKERYDRPKRLVLAHVNRLLSLDDYPKETRSGIRAVIDQFRKFIRAMKVLEQPTEQWDAMVFPIVYRKMPREAIGFVNRTMRSDTIPSVTEILRVIEDYSETVPASEEQSSASGSFARGKRLPQKSYVARAAASSSVCGVCDKQHSTAACYAFSNMSVNERNSVARALRLCFLCLEKGHNSLNCQAARCSQCSGGHHTLMCFNRGGDREQVQAGGTQPQVLSRA